MSEHRNVSTDGVRGQGGDAPPDDWSRVEAALEARLAAVTDEIRHYPAPISGCDAQFNHLLEQRSRIPAALARLRALRGGAATAEESADRLRRFVASCPDLDAAVLAGGPDN